MQTAPTTRTKTLEILHGKLQFASVTLPWGQALLGPLDRLLSEEQLEAFFLLTKAMVLAILVPLLVHEVKYNFKFFLKILIQH